MKLLFKAICHLLLQVLLAVICPCLIINRKRKMQGVSHSISEAFDIVRSTFKYADF